MKPVAPVTKYAILSSSEVFANRSGPYTLSAGRSGSAMLLEPPAEREYGHS
jgi:hypothetical protein